MVAPREQVGSEIRGIDFEIQADKEYMMKGKKTHREISQHLQASLIKYLQVCFFVTWSTHDL